MHSGANKSQCYCYCYYWRI